MTAFKIITTPSTPASKYSFTPRARAKAMKRMRVMKLKRWWMKRKTCEGGREGGEEGGRGEMSVVSSRGIRKEEFSVYSD